MKITPTNRLNTGESLASVLFLPPQWLLAWSGTAGLCIFKSNQEGPEPQRVILQSKESPVTNAVALSPHRFLTWGLDANLWLWNLEQANSTQRFSLLDPMAIIEGVVPLGPEDWLSWTQDGAISIWRAQEPNPWCHFPEAIFPSLTTHTLPRVQLVDETRAVAQAGMELCLLDLRPGKLTKYFGRADGEIQGMFVHAHDHVVAWNRRCVYIWNFESGDEAIRYPGHESSIQGVAPYDDSHFFSWCQSIHVWEGSTGRRVALAKTTDGHYIRTVQRFGESLFYVSLTTMGRWIPGQERSPRRISGNWSTLTFWNNNVVLTSRNEIELRDPTTLRLKLRQRAHEGIIVGVSILPDGRLATWSVDGTICLWNG